MKLKNQNFFLLFCFLFLLSNTLTLYNSLQIWHFQYKTDLEFVIQFNYLTNNYDYKLFYFYSTQRLIFNFLTQFIAFAFIKQGAIWKQKIQRIVAVVLLAAQLIFTFGAIWPFFEHSKYGKEFGEKKYIIMQKCEQKDQIIGDLQCKFCFLVFSFVEFSKIWIICLVVCILSLFYIKKLQNKLSFNHFKNKIKEIMISQEQKNIENQILL